MKTLLPCMTEAKQGKVPRWRAASAREGILAVCICTMPATLLQEAVDFTVLEER